jgi:aspartyl protease family protein
MFGWALRRLIFLAAFCGLWIYVWNHRAAIETALGPKPVPALAQVEPARTATLSNQLRFKPDPTGHVFLTVDINGTPTPCIVDTGATYVALSPNRVQAAGIDPRSLNYSERVGTANGVARAAPVTLREVRIAQLAMADVQAFVTERTLDMCLLGQSFLKRLDGFEMSDGVFVMKY